MKLKQIPALFVLYARQHPMLAAIDVIGSTLFVAFVVTLAL
jgi:hypothetical protein